MFTVRRFGDEDFWQVEDLVRQFMNNDPFSPPIIVRQMQHLFHPFFLVAHEKDRRDGEIHGYVMGGVSFQNLKKGWILGVFVRKDNRNRGVGSELIKEMIHQMEQSGITKIYLTVDEQNEHALKMYDKTGFEKIGCLWEHYRKDRNVLLMRKCIKKK